MGRHSCSSLSTCLRDDNLVQVGVCHPSSWQKRSLLHRVTWRCKLSLSSGVPLWIYGFLLFLQGSVAIDIQVRNLVLLEVVLLHGPKLSDGEVFEPVLHWTPCGVVDIPLGSLMEDFWQVWWGLLSWWNNVLSVEVGVFLICVYRLPLQHLVH